VVNDEFISVQYRGSNLRNLLCGLLKCEKQKVRIWTLLEGQDESIPKGNIVKLSKPIKPGFRRPLTLTPDEAVDQRADGTFALVEVTTGDSQLVYNPESTEKSIKVWAYGDGAIGDKAGRITVDGHIGDGDVPVAIDIEWTVANPDATALTLVEGTDEPIP